MKRREFFRGIFAAAAAVVTAPLAAALLEPDKQRVRQGIVPEIPSQGIGHKTYLFGRDAVVIGEHADYLDTSRGSETDVMVKEWVSYRVRYVFSPPPSHLLRKRLSGEVEI